MLSGSRDDKNVSCCQFPRGIPSDMKTAATRHDDQLRELVSMRLKKLLRISSLHTDRKAIRMKPLVNFQNFFHWRDRACFWLNSGGFFCNE